VCCVAVQSAISATAWLLVYLVVAFDANKADESAAVIRGQDLGLLLTILHCCIGLC